MLHFYSKFFWRIGILTNSNRAKTKFLLGLHRACVKDTTQCLQLDPNCTRAIILKGFLFTLFDG